MKKSRLLGAVCACVAMLVQSTSANAIVIGDKNWRQLTDTQGITYNALDANCTAAGICTGSVGSIDVDGWVWASYAEVKDLFNTILGISYFSGASFQYYDDYTNVNPGFDYTQNEEVWGMVRDPSSTDIISGLAINPYNQRATTHPEYTSYYAWYENYTQDFYSLSRSGAWMYQAVPIPPAIWLFGSGLLGLVGMARYKKK